MARGSRRASWLYLGLALLLGAFLLGHEIHDHGRTYDDLVFRARGESMLRFLASFDRAELPGDDLDDYAKGPKLYGSLASTVSVWLGRTIAPWIGDPTQDRHLVFSAGLTLWFLLLVFSTMQLGRHCLGGILGGALCGLALLAMPRVLGLATCNPSDMPAAAAAAFALWQFARWLASPTWARLVCVCLGLAATAAIRAQDGAPLLVASFFFVWPRNRARLPRAQLLVAPLLTYALWILLWPDFWSAPLSGPLDVVRGFSATTINHVQGTLWFGEWAVAPRLYPLVWTAITTPIWILVTALVGIVVGWRHPLFLGLLAWTLVAIGKHVTGLANFGGIRHFVGGFVPLAIWSAGGTLWLATRLTRRAGPALAATTIGLGAAYSASLHPFESLDFNAFVGGTRGAAGRFDLDPDGATFLLLMRELLPSLDERSVILLLGPTDLATQVALPEGVVVHPVEPATASLLETERVTAWLRDRRVFVVSLQSRMWGLLDPLVAAGRVDVVARVGPYGLPAGLALEVRDPSVPAWLGASFR